MLVLSRKRGESIEFADLDIEVRVVGLTKSKVQLGVTAPQDIVVNRSEVAGPNGGRRGCSGRDRSDLEGQILDELAVVEAELAALAELADAKDRVIARRVVADSIERLEGIKREIRRASRPQREARPISDFIKSRTESIENDVSAPRVVWPVTSDERTTRVRQSNSPYKIDRSPNMHIVA